MVFFESIVFFLCFQFKHQKSLEFDDKNLYEILKNEEVVIPLKSIQKIKRMLGESNNLPVWIIEYLDYMKNKKVLKFIPLQTLEKFIVCVREENKDVIVNFHPYLLDEEV